MRKSNKILKTLLSGILFLFFILICYSCNNEENDFENNWLPITENVNGEIQEVGGYLIFKLWGSIYEQGYAHGYLIGPEIISIMENALEIQFQGLTVEVWENEIRANLVNFEFDNRLQQEIRGMYEGTLARGGGTVYLSQAERELEYEDFLALTVWQQALELGCSSFAAWGNMTEDGSTIAGKNYDWEPTQIFKDAHHYIFIKKHPANSNLRSTAALGWSIGHAGTGINSDGVILTEHSTNGYEHTETTGIKSVGFVFVNALENAKKETAIQNVEWILKNNILITEKNWMVGLPHYMSQASGYVFEFDGNYDIDDGVTLRHPDNNMPFIICTNHMRERKPPIYCDRYERLEQTLMDIKNSKGTEFLTVAKAWEMLAGVQGTQTYHSVVFEPDKMLIHVAITEDPYGQPAPQCSRVTLDLNELFR
jgi:hypothetical protein